MVILLVVCFSIVTVGILAHEQATAVEPPAPEVLYYDAGMPDWVSVITTGCPAGYEGPYVTSAAILGRPPPGCNMACARCPAGKGLYLIQSYGSGTAQFMCSCGTKVWNGQTCVTPPQICTPNKQETVEYCLVDGKKTWRTRRTCSADGYSWNYETNPACTLAALAVTGNLTVIKKIITDNGGTATLANFTPLKVNSTVVTNGTSTEFNAGTYIVRETTQSGYSVTFGGACDSSGKVTLSVGDSKTCTITNDDVQPKLIVIKHVVNDNGGTAVASDWTMSVTGNSPSPASFPGAESPGTNVALKAGAYSVGESGPSGYTSSSSADCSGSIAVGETKTCTITNDDIAPQLKIDKITHGGEGTFVFAVDGPSQLSKSIDTSVTKTTGLFTVTAGTYNVSETALLGWSLEDSYCTNSTGAFPPVGFKLPVGESGSCTFRNSKPSGLYAAIKVDKVTNPSHDPQLFDFNLTKPGGSFVTFQLSDDSTPYDSGWLAPGPGYSVAETVPSDWDLISATCTGAGNSPRSITLVAGENVTCTFTDTKPPKLTVIKYIVNDNGGTGELADFTLKVNSTVVHNNTATGFNAGTYTVSETGPSGYAATFGGDCDPSTHQVTLTVGGPGKTCTVTNDDIPPRSIKQGVLQDLIALRGNVTDKNDGKKLDEAIKHLGNSLDQSLWLDETHLNPKKGEKVFNEEKDAVAKLVNLIKNKKSTVDKAKLQDFINRLLGADRGLASAAIDDASAAGGDAKKIAKANQELDKGDGRAARDDFAGAIRQYRRAWTHAQQAFKK